MKELLANIFLALIWLGISGTFTPPNLVLGFVIGYGILALLQATSKQTSPYFTKVWLLLEFTLFFFKELLVANVRLAYEVVHPGYIFRPAVVEVPLDAKSDAEITLLANLITLTPGTLSLDVSPDRRYLYIHTMMYENPEQFRREIKHGFERRVLEILR